MKPSLAWAEQVALLVRRGLLVEDEDECVDFLAAHNYYRFSGYMRYFQKAPHQGDDDFLPGTTLKQIREIYDSDHVLRVALADQLAKAELLLRTHTAHVIANEHGPYGSYLEDGFYTDTGGFEPTVDSCLKDIRRSRERHILRYAVGDEDPDWNKLPVWSAVEALSFGTLSKCIERGAQGQLSDAVATSLGAAKAGFAYR
ncbi:MAG: Abi family protein, partial [Actinomycetota bacterium]|nr:Abi family protein [Actinomycetota bacterium]